MASDVATDPELSPAERETIIKWASDEDRATVHSEEPAVIRWLLDHPEYAEEDRRINSGEQHSTTGTLPVGCVKLSGESRSSNYHSRVLGTLPDGDSDG